MQLWRRDRAAGSSTPRTPRWLSRCASLTAATAAAAAAPPAAAAAAPAPESPADGESAPAGPPQRILVSEVDVRGVTGELAAAAHAALTIRPDFAYTLEEEAVNRVFATGFFASCTPVAEDTRDGVRVTLDCRPNPVLTGVTLLGATALPEAVVAAAFEPQLGKTLNFRDFHAALRAVNSWYERRGAAGSVVEAELSDAGVCELRVREALVGKVTVRFLNRAGEPVPGATRPEVVTRSLSTRPGEIYSAQRARRDIDAVYALGIFEDVALVPAQSSGEAGGGAVLDVTVNIVERKTGGFSAGGGMSARGLAEGALSGMVGSFAYTQKNLFGRNQKLSASLEAGAVEKLFRLQHVDPWVDAKRTQRSLSLQNTRAGGGATHGRGARPPSAAEAAVAAAAAAAAGAGGGGGACLAGEPVVARLVAQLEYTRPLGPQPGWSAGWGCAWQRSGCRAPGGAPAALDCYGAPLAFSATAAPDVMALVSGRLVYAGPGDGLLVASAEQALPLRPSWLRTTRLQLRAEASLPLPRPRWRWLRGGGGGGARGRPGLRRPAAARAAAAAGGGGADADAAAAAQQQQQPQQQQQQAAQPAAGGGGGGGGARLALALRGGAILGDLPPYEAFPVGGTHSVRGYEEGGVGSGRRYAAASAELRFPVAGPVGGVLFADFGTDLGTGACVLGDPAGCRGKPGSGAGVGAGLRLDSPLGPWRLEYAVADGGARRCHIAMGRSF